MKRDHTHIYKNRSLRNWPHRRRLKVIRSIIRSEGLPERENVTYADVGCGTGFLTGILADMLRPSEVYGFDHSGHLEVAREKYPSFRFAFMELNEPTDVGSFDFVSCFETLEHVGSPLTALGNLLNATNEGGTLLVTVPIEIGPVGLTKFLVKTILYGYRLDELPGGEKLYLRYLISLILYRDISEFRDKRFGWGTHFGFDYRRIDEFLRSRDIAYRAKNVFTTRFYVIKPS
jgi:SAM-dependent methyltransferase